MKFKFGVHKVLLELSHLIHLLLLLCYKDSIEGLPKKPYDLAKP